MNYELLIENKSILYLPAVEDGVTWQTDRKGVPGELKFSVAKDGIINFQEGNPVRLKVNGENVFYGFVFTKKRTKDGIIDVVAYDQLRYFKNKDAYVFTSRTAGEFIEMLASDFQLQTGVLEDTGFIIPSFVAGNKTLFDMVQDTLDMTLQNRKEMFVMYDDFGRINLKNISSMIVDILIDEETGENFDYASSINEQTYNKIKLIFDNEDTGRRDVFIAQHSENINAWGVLQFFDSLQKGENGQVKADTLLQLYNQKSRRLSIKNAFGDVRVRAGSMVAVQLNLGDIKANSLMLVEKCKHTFGEGTHFMDLTLRGGGEYLA